MATDADADDDDDDDYNDNDDDDDDDNDDDFYYRGVNAIHSSKYSLVYVTDYMQCILIELIN